MPTRKITTMNVLLRATCLLLFTTLSLADPLPEPELINATEIEIKWARLYWNYTPVERVFSVPSDGQPEADGWMKLGYRFLVPSAERLSGITYVGHAARLRLALERARRGEALRVGALGGSITAGHGVGGGEHTYVQHFMDWLNAALPPRATLPTRALAGASTAAGRALRWLGRGRDSGSDGGGHGHGHERDGGDLGGLARRRGRGLQHSRLKHRFLNGAVPGTQSGYTSSCLANHIIPGPDLVFVEFAMNDSPLGAWGEQDSPRRPLERLFRKLLNLPSQPAVVLVNMFAVGPSRNLYWNTAERDFMEFATYYGLPAVSLKAAVLPPSLTGTTEQVAWKAIFNGGRNHPGHGAHVVVTELLITLVLELLRLGSAEAAAAASSIDTGASDGDGDADGAPGGVGGGPAAPMTLRELQAVAARPLPPPLFPGNFGATTDTCYIEDQLQALVQQPVEGWEWTDEGRGKWGYVAREPGNMIRLTVSTVVDSNVTEGVEPAHIILQVSYLQSFVGMGTARFRCESGCRCKPLTLDAYDPRPVSVAYVTAVQVTQHPQCVVTLTTGPPSAAAQQRAADGEAAAASGTDSGGRKEQNAEYKFKLCGIVVGEDPGATEGTVSFVRGNSADILKRVQAIGKAYRADGSVDEEAAQAAEEAFGHGG